MKNNHDIFQVDGYLVDTIMQYESDTFSADASKITEKEARIVADAIVKAYVDNRLDGVTIASFLEDIRDDEKNGVPITGKKFCNYCGYTEAQNGKYCNQCGKMMIGIIK